MNELKQVSLIWVSEDKLMSLLGFTQTMCKNYRGKIWLQGEHWVKIGVSGEANHRGRVMYNLPRIYAWIAQYPQQ
ncbi:excisionase family protein [Aliagarivorans taiwanensis]|uniref:excisionase family protein n=1 Tax=Aliagarivorans taiwanensis TaxID=561966 RepID=UPI00041BC0AA|nr:excisionase family protein [Aliagarivorans taiwanensis]